MMQQDGSNAGWSGGTGMSVEFGIFDHLDRNDLALRDYYEQHKTDYRILEAQKKIRAVLGRGAKSTLDAQTIEQLRSLGYLGGSRQ